MNVSLMTGDSPFHNILKQIEPDAKLIRHWPLSGGISCTMTALEIELSKGEIENFVVRLVSKWSFENYPNSVHNEHKLLLFLGENGIPVPMPRHSDSSCEILSRPYLVLDFVEGSPDLTVVSVTDRVVAMANQLADIHLMDISEPVFAFMSPSPVNIRPPVGESNETLQESKIRSALGAAFPTVVENPYRFRHGDFWPGNILWSDNQLAAVIDWEETSIGDPLFDVALTRLDTLWAYGAEAMNEFTKQYQSRMDIDYSHLPFWDLRVSLRPMSNIGLWATSFPPLGRPDVTEESMTTDHRWFVDQAIVSMSRP